MNRNHVKGFAGIAALVLAGSVVVSASADTTESDGASVMRQPVGDKSGTTIRLVEAASHGRDIDIKPKGESVGDYFVFHSVMENLQGRRVGRADGFGILTKLGEPAAAQHFVTLTLRDGQITTSYSPQTDIDNGNGPQAITGGTGRYRNASGQVDFVERGDRVIAVVRLTL